MEGAKTPSRKWRKEGWMRAIYAIRMWFTENGISLEGVRITIHLPDTQIQWQVRATIAEQMRDQTPYLVWSGKTMPPDEIELMGMRIQFINPERLDRPREMYGREL